MNEKTAWASYPFDGRVVLVTGGGTGIGQAIARAFLEEGASVCVVGRTAAALEETLAGFPDERTLASTADLTSRADVERVVADVVARFGRLDVVVNNAGYYEASDIDSFEDAAWEAMRRINVDALLYLSRAAVPHLKETRGNLVAISSVAGIRGEWGSFAYNATKGAVNTMIQGLALDLGASGVRANVIAPAFTATRLTRDRLDDPEFRARLLDRVALDRVADPADIARVALFLASPDAGYVTGAIVPVDGGTTASNGTPRPIAS